VSSVGRIGRNVVPDAFAGSWLAVRPQTALFENVIGASFGFDTALALLAERSLTIVLPEIVTDVPVREIPSSPYAMMLGFWVFGPCSITLFVIVALPPFGRSML
jgi:hypothetical protein